MYAALPGRTYPELIVRMARGEEIEPTSAFRAGITFTRYYWQLELDEQQPTGRDIVEPPGPPAPRRGKASGKLLNRRRFELVDQPAGMANRDEKHSRFSFAKA